MHLIINRIYSVVGLASKATFPGRIQQCSHGVSGGTWHVQVSKLSQLHLPQHQWMKLQLSNAFRQLRGPVAAPISSSIMLEIGARERAPEVVLGVVANTTTNVRTITKLTLFFIMINFTTMFFLGFELLITFFIYK